MASLTTLVDRLERAAERSGTCTFVLGGGEPDPVPWAEVHDEAQAMATILQAEGMGPGSHVALLGPTTRAFVTAIQAVWLSGATLVVLPLPMRLGSIEEFAAQTRTRLRAADVDLVVVDPDLAPFVEPKEGDPPFRSLTDLTPGAGAPGPSQWHRPDVGPDDLAVLQFTSGSTSDPKGVQLPHRTIGANLDALATAASLDVERDVLVSWLPLYHDMGLVGLLTTAMTNGADLVLGAPQDFLAAPGRWMEWISAFGGTATAGPNFAWVLAGRALKKGPTLDLSSLRVALNGAEPVDADAVEAFVEVAGQHGMRPGAVFPAFGMAELAIAGTFPEPLAGLRTDTVDGRVLETEGYAAPVAADADNARRLALLGRAVPGLEIRVVDPVTGAVRHDRESGELEIRGTSVTPGYYGRPDANADLFRDGWLRTGDLAYLLDGELVVCGRLKDLIIVGGRNVFPEDVERAVAAVEGVRAGNVIAFGVDRSGKEALVVVAEARTGTAGTSDHDSVRRQVADRVRSSVGLPAKDVVLVPPGSLPKTSSGKLQRSLCRQRYLDEDLTPA
jgi:fatty-acyl-CoA synthase